MGRLPFKDDYLIELLNNNYSKETIYNYKRDLFAFESYLYISGTAFNEVSKRTFSQYKGFLRSGGYLDKLHELFKKYYNENGILKNTDDEGKVFEEFKRHKPANHGISLSSKSVNRMLSAIRAYLNFLIEFDYECPMPPNAIKLIKTEKKEKQVAQLSDLTRLIECPEKFEKDNFVKLRNRAIMELLFSTGMRISELVSLDREQINDQGKIYVMGKGKKQRFVYLTERALLHLNAYIKLREDDDLPALFIPQRGGRNGVKNTRLSTNYLQEKISFYRKALGIVIPTSAHSFRHGFATYLAEEGANPAAIQILLGHESLHTTNRYVHASDRYAEETHKKFHPLKDA